MAPRPHAPLSYTPTHLAEKILTSKAALEGERKQVTVLFADLKGSMELLADRDPEDARAILDPVLERMMEAVHRYEGTVNQVMGDGIMALFGAPLAHEDHAVRACYAALAMQAALRQYSDEVRRTHGLPVHFRVGLNSGEVVVRAIDNDLHMDYSAIGQTVHLAARMEQAAIPGSIVLTPATVRLVEGLVRLNTLGPVPVRGLAEAVEVFELVGATAVRRRLQAGVARGLTRFVGRETEIAALAQALAWAGAGHGQGDQSQLAYVSSYRADYLRLSGSYDGALVAGQRALTLVVALGDIRLQAMTNEHLGVIYYSLGSYQRAMDCFRQSMASLESELLRERFGMAVPDAIESRTRLLLCLAEVGAFAEGVILGEEGIGLAEAINHPISLARACYGVGFVSLCKGDLHQAIARLERGLALCQTWSIRDWFLVLAAALGDAYALCGRLAEALPLLEQTVEQDAMRRRHLSSLWIAWLSEGYMLAGRLANAMPLARQALDLARDGRERGCEAWALRLLGEIHSHQDSLDTDQAAAHYRQALALAEALGMRPLQAHCHRGLGTLYTKIDQREQARAELSAAIALYRPMDMSFWLPQAEAALAQVEGR